jgi:Zn-dependent protease with chaperone function
MNELFFPMLGALLIVMVALPLCAAVSGVALGALGRLGGELARFSAARYLLLVFPSVLPVAWTISAALHQAETGRSVIACLISHDLEQLCVEPLLLVGILLAIVLGRTWPWIAEYRRASRVRPSSNIAAARRVAALVANNQSLHALRGRFVITAGSTGGSATLGLWTPTVALDAGFVDSCDDEALEAVLAHELEHVRGRDPLRYFVLALGMRLNPLGDRLLGRAAAGWVLAREMQCDRAAVLAGARPLGLASALVAASRPAHPALAHVRGGAFAKLKLRIELLMAYEEQRPSDDSRRGASALAVAAIALVFVLWLPHDGGTAPLDALHTAIERATATTLD